MSEAAQEAAAALLAEEGLEAPSHIQPAPQAKHPTVTGNRRIPDDARDLRGVEERLRSDGENLVAGVFADAPRVADEMDAVFPGALAQASDALTPWRSKTRNRPTAAPVETLSPQKPKTLTERYQAMTPEQRNSHLDAVLRAQQTLGEWDPLASEEEEF